MNNKLQIKASPEDILKNYYGTTGNFDQAGYILTDGDMLMLFPSEGQYEQTIHSDVQRVVDTGRSDGLMFMLKRGHIRIRTHEYPIPIELMTYPTEPQIDRLGQLLEQYRSAPIVLFLTLPGGMDYQEKKFISPTIDQLLRQIRLWQGTNYQSPFSQFREGRLC